MNSTGIGLATRPRGSRTTPVAGRHRSKITGRGKGEGFVWARVGDVTYVSVYISPNLRRSEFLRQVERMEDALRDISGLLLVAGDFNARAIEWGMPVTNSRGKDLLAMAARLGLVVTNEGSVTTYRRPGFGESISDITFASEQLVPRIIGWQVLEEETGSDHQYISFTVLDSVGRPQANRPLPWWNTHRLNKERLVQELRVSRGDDENGISGRKRAEAQMSRVTSAIVRACEASMPRSGNRSRRQPAYWWTEEIAELCRACLRLRRRVQCARERRGATALNAEFKQAQKRLRLAIKASKRRCWKEVCDEVNSDP